MEKHRKEQKYAKKVVKSISNKLNLNKAKERFLEATNMPIYLQKSVSRVTILDNVHILIEQYKSIEDYFTHYIKIRCESFSIIIEGKDLSVDEITKEELIIKGKIDSISYKN